MEKTPLFFLLQSGYCLGIEGIQPENLDRLKKSRS